MSKTYKIPYINLEYNQEKLKERDIRWNEIKKERPDLKKIPNDDKLRFQPWTPISKETHTNFRFLTNCPWYSQADKLQNTQI